VRVGLGRDLAQFVDDMGRRRAVRIAHAEVDDVLAARAGRGLHRIDLREHVRRQPANAVEVVVHWPSLRGAARRSNPVERWIASLHSQ
jgi:hypothetical protein